MRQTAEPAGKDAVSTERDGDVDVELDSDVDGVGEGLEVAAVMGFSSFAGGVKGTTTDEQNDDGDDDAEMPGSSAAGRKKRRLDVSFAFAAPSSMERDNRSGVEAKVKEKVKEKARKGGTGCNSLPLGRATTEPSVATATTGVQDEGAKEAAGGGGGIGNGAPAYFKPSFIEDPWRGLEARGWCDVPVPVRR